ncbi:DegT/DnrJ/EryC1/StrS family aminotransferase [Planomonospora algeriensis]
MSERVGAACLHVPSARFGLYLALRHWFGAGDRVLIAPTNCETVLFIALAAGVRPVMAPVSPDDGNIDPDLVDWTGLAGVLTTHLYGQPDRVVRLRAECDRRSLVLIDDAAHAMLTTVDGRPAGTFGAAGVFSLAKHGRAMSGGFLTVEDPGELPALARLRDGLLLDGGPRAQILGALRPMLRETVYRTGLVRPMWRTLKALGVIEWTGHRCAPREEELVAALKAMESSTAPAGLDGLGHWLRIDLDDWRMRQGGLLRAYQRSRFRVVDRERERRLAGVELLRGLPWRPGRRRVAGGAAAPGAAGGRGPRWGRRRAGAARRGPRVRLRPAAGRLPRPRARRADPGGRALVDAARASGGPAARAARRRTAGPDGGAPGRPSPGALSGPTSGSVRARGLTLAFRFGFGFGFGGGDGRPDVSAQDSAA